MYENERTLVTKLTQKQKVLWNAFVSENITEILYGWGARWWKSWWVWEIICHTCFRLPWIVWLVWRREWDDLRKTTLNTILKVLNSKWMRDWREYKLNLQTKELRFYNSSRLYFVPLKENPSDPEFNWLWWYEITFWYVDEAQEVNRKAINIILSRCTEKIKEYHLKGKVIMTCNPMKCHLYNDFIKAQQEWSITSDRIFIPALYKDNPFIDHEKYEESLKRADKITKERLLNWNWEYDDDPTKLFEYDDIKDLFFNAWEDWEKYITADIARMWKDKTVIIVWSWWIWKVFVLKKTKTTEIANMIRWLQEKYAVKNSKTICDEDWVWWGVVDQLSCNWFINNSSPILKDENKGIRNYKNLKDQCYFELVPIISSNRMKLLVDNDNDRECIIEELDVIKQKNPDKWWKLQISTKNEIKRLLWRSPDFADAIAMRMWFELNKKPEVQIYFIDNFNYYV